MNPTSPRSPRRRALTAAMAAAAFGPMLPAAPAAAATAAGGAAAGPKVLRYAFRVAETGFDPAKISDLYSRTVTPHIFEGLYTYDHLARPSKIKPLVADGMPQVSADFRVWTVKIRPGIYFADDPAFKGKRRELVAQDFVYSIKRFLDPANKSPAVAEVLELKFVGLEALRQAAIQTRQPFDYDRDVPGLRALDRYTLRIELEEPRPRFDEFLSTGDLFGAVAREVVETYGDQIAAHPVGTGPFVLAQWRRSSLIVLERNPQYRERFYDAEPAPDDAEGQAMLARFKGRRIPMVDRVEVSIIDEQQPRWLSFLNRQQDFIERVGDEFIGLAMPGGKLAPNLAKRHVRGFRTVGPESTMLVFNMDDPVIGGYTPEKVALRRAISLATDISAEISRVRRGSALPAQSPIVPHTYGYDPAYKSETSDYDPARARALLDLFGYVDRDGDGWRERPDGSPLVLVRHTEPQADQRQLAEIWQKNMEAVGLRTEFRFQKWPENLKSAQAGTLMIWGVASAAAGLDGVGALQRLYSPAKGGQNLARFKLPEFDEMYSRMQAMPNGPERAALILRCKRINAAYLPYKNHVHRIYVDLAHPWLVGYRRPLFWQDWWQYVDIDDSKRADA
jgi:ABC-type transport system substrate-binding protein